MTRHLSHPRRSAALIVVLAFVVLLTGVSVAYFSRTVSDRQAAHSSFNQSNADQLAESAIGMIIGDLRQEIINGSNATVVGSSTVYLPTNNAHMLPVQSPTASPGTTPAIPNLIRRSTRSDAVSAPAMSSRASATNSTGDNSANGRSVSLTRWNSHYLIPKSNVSDDKSDPVTTGFASPNYWAPDWVIVTRDGPAPFAAWNATLADSTFTNTSYAVGRYAYAIYDEGGLLDMNVAGYPTGTTALSAGRKGYLAFADLTSLPFPIPNPNSDTTPVYKLDKLIGVRHYATTQPSNTYPGTTAQPFAKNFQDTATAATNYYSMLLSSTNGLLSPSSAVYRDRTDRVFLNRQELITYARSGGATGGFTVNALQYLGTFSREIELPTWSPTTPTAVNPDFRTTVAVQRRFPLSRLVWLTYKGPSALRTATEADMVLLTGTYGIPISYLTQGTVANIQNYFGLIWNAALERWDYVGPTGVALQTTIANVSTILGREPNFFELLQAGISDDSLGGSIPSTFPINHQQSKMLHVLTIGANLISQVTVDSYPTRIGCTLGTATMEATGTERLPYLNSMAACAVGCGLPSKTGGVSWLLIPNIWDPYRNSSSLVTLPLRPSVQITMNGTATFAGQSATATIPLAAAVTTGVTGLSRTLLAGNSSGGRDGLVGGYAEPARLSSADLPSTSPPTDFNPYPFSSESSNGTVPSIGWRLTNSISGSFRYAAMRLSHPGTAITLAPTVLGTNPALILNAGFQVTLDYQSPSGTWRSYSFLQGNNDPGTWMPTVQFTAKNSIYALVTGTGTAVGAPTITSSTDTSAITPWAMATLNLAPTFIKSDPRSIRFNSVVDTLSTASTAAVVNSIWPSGAAPGDLGSGTKNPALYAQNINGGTLFYRDGDPTTGPVRMGDNGPAVTNPYMTGQDTSRPMVLNRPFRSVAEMGYAFRDQPFKSLDFLTGSSADAGLLDLFCLNENTNTTPIRAGVINLNTRQAPVLTAMLNRVVQNDDLVPNYVPSTDASTLAQGILNARVNAVTPTAFGNKAELVAVLAAETTLPLIKTQHEATLRALTDVGQTRTWNLMIDVIAQSGRYGPNAATVPNPSNPLANFIVHGEQRYWVHVAIDRFTGEVIDKQIEVVNE